MVTWPNTAIGFKKKNKKNKKEEEESTSLIPLEWWNFVGETGLQCNKKVASLLFTVAEFQDKGVRDKRDPGPSHVDTNE